MGDVYDIACTACPYRSTVYEGACMEAVITTAVCPRCRELREAGRPAPLEPTDACVSDALDERCEVCGTALEPWPAGSAESLELRETWTPGPCPRCGALVVAQHAGIWD